MAIIIPSKIDSNLESSLRSHDRCECILSDYFYFVSVDENNIVDNTFVADFGVAEERSSRYNKDYIVVLSGVTYSKEEYPGMFSTTGDIWDPVNKVFYEVQPFASWILNTTTWMWEAPIPYPQDGMNYVWNEEAYQADNTTGWEHPYPEGWDPSAPE